ncbi:MAG TPA: hypothetical protein H9880_06660, partial [Candidatus Anaerobutyricum avicola]|nr:hypothetical protein [Candidatus Anaerobutyricum avicola]
GLRTCRRTAGNPEKEKCDKDWSKSVSIIQVCSSFVQVRAIYRLLTNHCNPFIYHFVKTIQQCVDKTRKKLHNKKNVYIIVSQKISNKLKE